MNDFRRNSPHKAPDGHSSELPDSPEAHMSGLAAALALQAAHADARWLALNC